MQTVFCKLNYVYLSIIEKCIIAHFYPRIHAILYKFGLTAAVICLIITVRYCWSIRVIFMAIDHLQDKEKVKEIRI